ncbi:MAG: ABC transporter permease [Pirellulales bacterium]|nr:ABC transporter permease [Pirellulales bacterium]
MSAKTNSTSRTVAHTVPALPVVGTLCERELVRFFRQTNRVLGALGQPIIFWLLFGAGLGSAQVGESGRLDYAHFFPGTIVMILLFTAIFATISIIEDRREGFLQGVLVAPVPRWAMVLGKILGGSAIAMLQGLVFLLLGWLTGALGWAQVITATPSGLLCAILLMAILSIALTALGFLIAWRMDSTQGFHAIMSVVLLPMWLLSAAFFPMNVGGWLGWIVRLNPLTYGVVGLRHCLQNGGGEAAQLPSLALCWGVSLAFAAVTFSLAWWIAGSRSTADLL